MITAKYSLWYPKVVNIETYMGADAVADNREPTILNKFTSIDRLTNGMSIMDKADITELNGKFSLNRDDVFHVGVSSIQNHNTPFYLNLPSYLEIGMHTGDGNQIAFWNSNGKLTVNSTGARLNNSILRPNNLQMGITMLEHNQMYPIQSGTILGLGNVSSLAGAILRHQYQALMKIEYSLG